MKQLVTFPDAEAVMLAYLKPQWEDQEILRGMASRPASFSNAFPAAAPTGLRTHLQVELDGTPIVEYPAVERATVRVTLWSAPGKTDSVKEAAAVAQGLVAVHPGSAQVGATRILTGRLKGVDPATKYPFVSFTARVSLRPTAL